MEKQIKILIHVNTFAPVNQFVYANHIELFTRTVTHYLQIRANEISDEIIALAHPHRHSANEDEDLLGLITEKAKELKSLKSNFQMFLFNGHRSSIDRMRHAAAVYAMHLDCDYLLFLDDDVLVPTDGIVKLIAAKKDICHALVIIRGLPFNVMAFRTKESTPVGSNGYFNDIVDVAKKNGDPVVSEGVAGGGFSMCLINMEVIRAMEPPYFITGPTHTEDAYFCDRALNMIEDPVPTIAIHTGVQCGHLMGNEAIQYDSLPEFIAFYEALNAKNTSRGAPAYSRDEEFVKRTLRALD